MNLHEQLAKIEAEQARLAALRNQLEEEARKVAETNEKFDRIVRDSGYGDAKALIAALTAHYKLGAKRGRKAGTAAAPAAKVGKRRRIKVTAEFRDKVKADLAGGASMNGLAKGLGVSYLVIAKIAKGAYDSLA